MEQKKNAYQEAAENLIAQLEVGTIPWRKPWVSAGMPRNLVSKKEYSGMNVFILAMQNYASPYWLTFKQAQGLGGTIQKGEHGTRICKYGTYDRKSTNEAGEESKRRGMYLQNYTVFNVAQCNPELLEKLGLNEPVAPIEDLPHAQIIWDMYPNRPELKEAGKAYYRPSDDHIGMPPRGSFQEQREFYSTLFHEMVHSTGAAKRLNREGVVKPGKSFGDQDYSKEELVAEFGAAMLCGVCGIAPAVIQNSAAYIKCWLEVLKASDNKTILQSAMSQASKACDHIRASKVADTTPEEKPAEQEAIAI